MKVPISRFTLIDDFREEVGDVSALAHSIANPDIGLLHPVRVDKNFNILEGRRRFRALRDYLKLEELEEGVHFIFRETLHVTPLLHCKFSGKKTFKEKTLLQKKLHNYSWLFIIK